MSKYTENSEKWLQLSEIDYFTHFVKAWIPFNAWYRTNYPDATSDRVAINQIKNESNRFKDGFKRLIQNNNLEAKDFSNNLAQLHYYLENALIENGRDNQISFSKILEVDKTNLIFDETYRGSAYHVKLELNRISEVSSVLVTVKKNSATVFNYTHNKFDPEHLNEIINGHNGRQLTNAQKDYLIPLFKQRNPRKIKSLIVPESCEHFKIGEYCFEKSIDKLFAGLIEVLYSLRNGLFHGEIVPDKHSSKVYKFAYEVLKNLLDQIH